MDTELLKTFLEVQRTRHFGRAAENLYLTQAAVSARIKQLETSLGGPVFTRYRNNLQLTESGRRLVPHAESILVAWERAKQEVSLNSRKEMVLAIGATNGLWDLFLQRCLLYTFQKNPEVVLRADANSQDILVRHILDRTLDLAFVYEPAKHTDILSIRIADVNLVLVHTNDASTEFQVPTGYIDVDWGVSFNISFAKHYGNIPVVMHTSLARIALESILTYSGSAYLPIQMVEPYLGKELNIEPLAPVFTRTVYACYHRGSMVEMNINQFIENAKVNLASKPNEGSV